jgi:hypothetical protein
MAFSLRGKTIFKLSMFLTTLLSTTTIVKGHGRLMEPPSRSTAFRFGFATPHNYNDNQLSCGGYWVVDIKYSNL